MWRDEGDDNELINSGECTLIYTFIEIKEKRVYARGDCPSIRG